MKLLFPFIGLFRRMPALAITIYLGLLFAELFYSNRLISSFRTIPILPIAEATQIHKTVDYETEYHYNRDGMRGPLYDAATNYDYLFLGDSFLFGQGVPESETCSARLAARGFKVLNYSEIATGPLDYFTKLTQLTRQGLQAKNIVFGFFIGNDFIDIAEDKNFDQLLQFDSFVKKATFFEIPRIRFIFGSILARVFGVGRRSSLEWYLGRTYEPDWVDWFTQGDSSKAEQMRNPAPIIPKNDKEYITGIALSAENQRRVISMVKQAKALLPTSQFTVLLIPDTHFMHLQLGSDYKQQIDKLSLGLKQLATVIDLHSQMNPSQYFPRDGHWNSEGHAFCSELFGR